MYWIGGGSGAGKSTVARGLAARYGMRVYATDEVMGDHARRSTPEDAPYLAEFIGMDMDERWLNRSPETMLETFHWYRGEGFGLIVDDLREPGTPVVAEGFRLLPELVMRYAAAGHAVWLLPTPEFREVALESRGSTWSIAGNTSDPPRALRNLLTRDRMFTDRLTAQVRDLGLPTVEVDGTRTEDQLVDRVADLFRLPPR